MVLRNLFLQLVRLGIGISDGVSCLFDVDLNALMSLASQHGLSAIVLDGLDAIPEKQRPTKSQLLQWIGITMQEEQHFAIQWKAACELALLLEKADIRTYVLKGFVVSECYPKPAHRCSVDIDCFLSSEKKSTVAWEQGNFVVENAGFEVKRDYYKNSTWVLPGLIVENHRWLTPFRGNKRLTDLERLLQELFRKDSELSVFDGTGFYRPPVMVSALFLIEHAYSHFLHEGLTWRHVLDWMMFSREHQEEINWLQLNKWIDEFGFRKFYDSFMTLGKFLLGEVDEVELSDSDKMMQADIWEPLDLHETVDGIKGKLNLVGNTWRARWKYREFADISWLKALSIQVNGVLFLKELHMS